MPTSTIKAERKITLPTRYPVLTMTSALSQVMVTVSPPVSPRVVARILMIQNPRMTSGTLLAGCSAIRAISDFLDQWRLNRITHGIAWNVGADVATDDKC